MKILVTGAGGFVGRRLVALLAKDGHVVYAMVRRDLDSDQKECCNYKNVHVLKQNLSSLITSDLPQDIDALISLAQSSHFRDFPKQAEEVFEVGALDKSAIEQQMQDLENETGDESMQQYAIAKSKMEALNATHYEKI